MSVRQRGPRAGFTLIEVLIAVSLVGLLSLAMLVAIRVALNAELKATSKLIENRRVVGAQRALEQEINGFMPEIAVWIKPDGGGARSVPFFEGQPSGMRFVSSFSLNGASRDLPQLLEFAVIPGDRGEGFRLIVNELPYRGGYSAGERIAGFDPDSSGLLHPVFFPAQAGPSSFVLADRLAYCRMFYLGEEQNPTRREWRTNWVKRLWPLALRVEMAPLAGETAQLHPMSVTASLHAFRDPDKKYSDEPGLKQQ